MEEVFLEILETVTQHLVYIGPDINKLLQIFRTTNFLLPRDTFPKEEETAKLTTDKSDKFLLN